jgi:hypothetical protein
MAESLLQRRVLQSLVSVRALASQTRNATCVGDWPILRARRIPIVGENVQ